MNRGCQRQPRGRKRWTHALCLKLRAILIQARCESPAVAARGAFIRSPDLAAKAARAWKRTTFKPAGVAELADAQDLGSCDASRGGSSPSARTMRVRGRTGIELVPHRRGRAGMRWLRQKSC